MPRRSWKTNSTNVEKAKEALGLKAKADYVRFHRRLWDLVIEKLEDVRNGRHPVPRSGYYGLKSEAFKELFGTLKITSGCFACEWAVRKDAEGDFCVRCLFNTKRKKSWEFDCLGGLFFKLEELADRKDWNGSIKIARRIRNLKA